MRRSDVKKRFSEEQIIGFLSAALNTPAAAPSAGS